MLGFFSFTEITDASAHRAYNQWHQFDHLPEQYSIDGILFGQRWVASPACQAARVAVSPLLAPCHYMTLYLMRDHGVLPEFFDLAQELRAQDRFFASRTSHLSGPFEVTGRWAAERVKVSAQVVPYRPGTGVFVWVAQVSSSDRARSPGAPEGAALHGCEGVAGAWTFASTDPKDGVDRSITVAFIDGDLASAAADLGNWTRQHAADEGPPLVEWAGPLARIDPNSWDWFDRLTPQ